MNRFLGRLFAAIGGAALAMASIPGYAAEAAEHWGYSGNTGPAKWDKLSKEFKECKIGELQSPIDIPDAKARKGDLAPLLFNYKPSPLRIIASLIRAASRNVSGVPKSAR